jgi:hypothetical protein
VGGTTLNLNLATAANPGRSYGVETPWSGSGGGGSAYETQPSYQAQAGVAGGGRTTPDVAFDASPATGVAVEDGGSWLVMGGTSVGAPGWAALVAIANAQRVSSGGATLDGPSQTLPAIYGLPASDFHQVGVGRGSPVANLLVPDLAASGGGGEAPAPRGDALATAEPVVVDFLLDKGLLAPLERPRAGHARPALVLARAAAHPTFRPRWVPQKSDGENSR